MRAPMLLPDWMDPEILINSFIDRFGAAALVAICVVVLIETGLLFPFLPGDSLLFTVGLFIGTGALDVPLWLACLALFGAALAGDQIGYAIGRRAGPAIFRRPDSRFFKQQYIDQTHAFFERYGGRAIILARFVPFVRTYIPVAAGIGKMDYKHFLRYNAVGALLWGVGVTLLGYWLGRFDVVKNNIEIALMLVVGVSLIPIVVEWIKHRIEARRASRLLEAAEQE
ncbi:VTT domain-containing protein [Demequina sp.]|uniref:DedA family protein n=1 Tax=Demequina sp. TaxID=2050685 RepID=UPI0025C682F8|nr:VTT domain-containing protein [Demequina sp.]